MTTPRPLAEVLANVRVRAWSCLVPEHGERKCVTVEWIDGVAHCTQPGCDLTSEHTQRFAEAVREHLTEDAAQADPTRDEVDALYALVDAVDCYQGGSYILPAQSAFLLVTDGRVRRFRVTLTQEEI